MSRTTSPSSGKLYGVAAVCRIWRAARATVFLHRAPGPAGAAAVSGPIGPMPDAQLVEAIRRVLHDSPYHGEGHRKVWARLRTAGIRSSKRRVLRIMRENTLLAPSRSGRLVGRRPTTALSSPTLWT